VLERNSKTRCLRQKEACACGRGEFVLKADSIILALGQQADYEVLGSYAIDRESLGTTEKSVFVAGDFVNGQQQ
jgi:NADPH-dependent glutamate synthase beta subunit-like oxidoreductase